MIAVIAFYNLSKSKKQIEKNRPGAVEINYTIY